MKLAQLSLALPARRESASAPSRLGPRRVTALARLERDPDYALRELLNAVQALAQGPFQGEREAQQAACVLAEELRQLGANATRLLCPAPLSESLHSSNRLVTKA
ncbi:MAG: hypothetical protein LBS89_01380 [Zoogloeaceae bacterium]|jgi:hypothetical protein|nr:hypothetical protein [Zoogloeaceae bacterium]